MAEGQSCQQEPDHGNQGRKCHGPEEQPDGMSDNILRHAGITRNTEYDLAQGKTAIQILEENMTGVQVLDLSGCSLDAVLYYVNQDIPVLAILEDGEAVLVTGFNEFNVVIMEPSTGKLYKKGMNDATTWFAENGNHFISYMKIDN